MTHTILQLHTTYSRGGAARVAQHLFMHPTPTYPQRFAYGRGKPEPHPGTYHFGHALEHGLHAALVRLIGLEGHGSPFSTRRLIQYILNENISLVHIHNLHGYYVDFFKLFVFLRTQGIPLVWTLHDEWAITSLKGYSHDCSHCLLGYGTCTNPYPYPKSYFPLLTPYMHHRKHTVFGEYPVGKLILTCPSQWLQKRLQRSYLGHYPIQVIPNGVDTTCFTPAKNKSQERKKHGLPQDKKIILFSAANLQDTSKGSTLIPLIAQKLAHQPYLFLGIGDGNLPVAPNIQTTGYIHDRHHLAGLMGTADIFCFLSSLETFSLATAEALACGVPVVGFDLPVIREMVTPDVGLLTPHGDLDALCQTLDLILSAPARLATMALASRQRMIAQYDEKMFIAGYQQVYDLLLQGPYQ